LITINPVEHAQIWLVFIHPAMKRQLANRWDEIISELRYGCISIKAWAGS